MAGWQDAPVVSGWQSAPVVSEPESAPEQPKEPETLVGSIAKAGAAIVNDFEAGTQGINPVALSKKAPFGMVRNVNGVDVIDVDGEQRPVSDYPADMVVFGRGQDGNMYAYARSPDLEESRAASAGRMLGLSNPATRGMPAPKAPVRPQSGRAQAAQAADELGITPTLGMTGKAGATVEAGLDVNPFSGGRIAKDTARVAGEIEGAAAKAIGKVGQPTNNQGAGEALKEGAETFVTGFKSRADKLFDSVSQYIPGGTTVAAPESAAAIRKTLEGFEGTPEIRKSLGLDQWAKIADDLESGNLTWEALRRYRSQIGQAVGKISGPLANMDQGQLKNLYGKLSDDLTAIAESAGPEAGRAWKRANQFYSAGQKRIEGALSKVLKADTPEKAYNELLALTKADSPRGSVAKLSELKRSIPAENWGEVAATVLTKMGQATAGAQGAAGDTFSPATFLTNWNKTSPEARQILAAGGLDSGAAKELTALAKVVEKFKEAGGARNFSNTGRANNVLLFLAGSALDLGTTAAVAGGSVLSARALTNKTFLRALNRAAKNDTSMLKRIATSDSPLAIEAQTILRLQLSEQAEAPSLSLQQP